MLAAIMAVHLMMAALAVAVCTTVALAAPESDRIVKLPGLASELVPAQ